MTQSPARRTFKELAGQSNHYLITIKVGLDAVRTGTVAKSRTLAAAWQPQDVKRSADRSEEFAHKALVSWLVDALDAYLLSIVTARPALVPEPGNDWYGMKRSVHKKTDWAAERFGLTSRVEYAFAVTAIVWRNRLVHYGAENPLPEEAREILQDNADDIEEAYQGLNVTRLIERFEASQAPRFKEVTSLVRGVHKYVERVDEVALAQLDWDRYFMNGISSYVAGAPERRVANIWGKEPVRRAGSLEQLARQLGLRDSQSAPGVDPKTLERLAAMSHKEARAQFCS